METFQQYVDQFNAWSLAGGHLLIKEYASYAFMLMAVICFIASIFEKRTPEGRLTVVKTDKHYLLLVMNWVFGSMISFSLIYNGHIMGGLTMLTLIYCVPWSREISCNVLAPLLNMIPKFFWNTSAKENRLREKRLRHRLYKLALVPHKKSA